MGDGANQRGGDEADGGARRSKPQALEGHESSDDCTDDGVAKLASDFGREQRWQRGAPGIANLIQQHGASGDDQSTA